MSILETNLRDNSMSSDEEEDEDAKELTDDIEKNFFKTLSCLKKDDPKIYDESVTFFDFSTSNTIKKHTENHNKTSNPVYLEEYKRTILLEHGPEFDDTVEISDVLKKEKVHMSSPSYVEEQQAIKESFKGALDDNSDDEDILKPRIKTKEEQEKEDNDYLEWLKGNKPEIEDKEFKNELQHLHDYWNNPNLDEGEQFLCDYILNKRFLEKPKENLIEDEMRFSEEDEMLEKHEEFEHKYNFRFEEPDKEFIKTYPRLMESSLRRKEEKRKKKREEVIERKKKDLEKRSLEIKKLKKLKKKEIIDRIKKIQEITGNKHVGFKDTELEEDFNPTEYDRKMHELFDEEFYDEMDDEKPVFDEEEDEFIMDCEYDPSMNKRAKKTRAAKRKEKKNSIVNDKCDGDETKSNKRIPKYNPAMGSFEKYIDEYYSLDCEDVVSGVPTRYTYNKVLPNDYGLTIEEILLADDKELNKWYPIGKLTKIQPETVQRFEAKIYKRKAKDIELKKKMLPSIFKEELNELGEIQEKKKEVTLKKKKKRAVNVFKVEEDLPNSSNELHNRKMKNNKQLQNKNSNECQVDHTPKESKIIRNTKKDKIHKINYTENDKNVIKHIKNKEKRQTNHTQNNHKDIKKEVSSQKYHNQDKSKNIKKGVKRKINLTQNGLNKKQKFSEKYKPNVLESMTDDRLKAYGINPKKFRNKLKFGKNE